MPTNTIKDILGTREFETRNGQFTSFKVEMSDGSVGEINKKRGNIVKVGDTIEYTVESNGNFPDKFKLVQANSSFGGNSSGATGGKGKWNGDSGSHQSFALSYAKDIIVALITAGVIKDLGVIEGQWAFHAENAYNFLESKKPAAAPVQEIATPPQQAAGNGQSYNADEPAKKPENCMALSQGDYATSGQVKFLCDLAEKQSLDAGAFVQANCDGAKLNEINRPAASYVIDLLRAM